MKTKNIAFPILVISGCAFFQPPAIAAAQAQRSDDFPQPVAFELGEAEFAPGDSITLQAVRGTDPQIKLGQSYLVTGYYTLSSRAEAELSFYVTTTNETSSPTDPRQTVRIQKGTGSFALIKTMDQLGYPHLSFYPTSAGSSFGGVYFGQGEWVLRKKPFSYATAAVEPGTARAAAPAVPESIAPQNRRIFEYLGEPVAAPRNLDPAYSKEGLLSAIRLAADKAGVTPKRIEIEDSEFPFLVGMIYAEGDWEKMLPEVKKLPAYEEQGGVSSKTCRAINLVPWRAFPSGASETISHRMTIREQMFYNQLSRE